MENLRLFDVTGVPKRPAEPKLAFDALSETTLTPPSVGRGELNHSLKLIRALSPDLADFTLAGEIRLRARTYHETFPNMALTPTALAKHWLRLTRPHHHGTNLHAPTGCPTCGGDGYIETDNHAVRCPACS